MTMEPNEQRQSQSHSRSSKRNAYLWGLLAAICTILAALGFGFGPGFGAIGHLPITLGSIVLAIAAGLSLNLAERSLNSRTGLPRALGAVALGVILMIMFYSADNLLLFMAACVGTLFAVVLAVIAVFCFRRTSAGHSSS